GSPSRSSWASAAPVDAPEGTLARPKLPSSRIASTSTVGRPRESRISRACTVRIATAFTSPPLSLHRCLGRSAFWAYHPPSARVMHVLSQHLRRNERYAALGNVKTLAILLLIGPDRPAFIIKIQLRHDVRKRDVGLPVGVDRPHVPPVRFTRAHIDAALREVVHVHRRAAPDQRRNDVLAEVVRGSGIIGVAQQLGVEE